MLKRNKLSNYAKLNMEETLMDIKRENKSIQSILKRLILCYSKYNTFWKRKTMETVKLQWFSGVRE
jgi:hypothetical protein